MLDTLRGEILYVHGCGPLDVTQYDIKDVVRLKTKEYTTLALIRCPGRGTWDASRVPERAAGAPWITEVQIWMEKQISWGQGVGCAVA